LFNIVDDCVIEYRVIVQTFLYLLHYIISKSFLAVFLKDLSFAEKLMSSVEEGIVKGETELSTFRNTFNIFHLLSKINNGIIAVHM